MDPERALRAYYARRAPEYEAIYALPERQGDLAALERELLALVAGRRVLEVACGTGYWTERAARAAASVVATDAAPAVLRLARAKCYRAPTRLAAADAWVPQPFRTTFEVVVAGFFWSHVARRRLGALLATLHPMVAAAGRVVLFDNRFVTGSSTPLEPADPAGDTWQRRRLAGGEEHLVRKNFPAGDEVVARVTAAGGREVRLVELDHYWLVTYRPPAATVRR